MVPAGYPQQEQREPGGNLSLVRSCTHTVRVESSAVVSAQTNKGFRAQAGKVQLVRCPSYVGKADSENSSIFHFLNWKDSEGFESASSSL